MGYRNKMCDANESPKIYYNKGEGNTSKLCLCHSYCTTPKLRCWAFMIHTNK